MKFWGEPAVELNTLWLLSNNKNESSEVLFFPHRCFSEEWSVGAGGSGGGGLLWGRLGVRAGVKRKRVIVTELTRKSRGGQCADRTLGCMIHRRGPNMNPLESSSLRQTRPPPPPPPLLKPPPWAYIRGNNTEAMANHLTSPLVWATPSIWC